MNVVLIPKTWGTGLNTFMYLVNLYAIQNVRLVCADFHSSVSLKKRVTIVFIDVIKTIRKNTYSL